MCDSCSTAHAQLFKLFKDHKVVSAEDILSGKERIIKSVDKCIEHQSERREFYCEDCRVIICHKCTVVKHSVRDHVIRERADFEREVREKVDVLVERCDAKRMQVKNHIRDIEQRRNGVRQALEKVVREIRETYEIIINRLEERMMKLMEEVREFQRLCDTKLDVMKESARNMSTRLSTSSNLIAKGRYGGLEGDSLTSHNHLCNELEELLNEDIEGAQESTEQVTNMAQQVSFVGVHNDIDIGEVGPRGWEVTKEVNLPYDEALSGMAVKSPCSVVIAYDRDGAETLSLEGDRAPYLGNKLGQEVMDITYLTNGRIVVLDTYTHLQVYEADGQITDIKFETPNSNGCASLDSDMHDNIFVSYWKIKMIYIFMPTGGKPVKTIPLERIPQQVHTTRCGHMVVRLSRGVVVLTGTGEEVSLITRPSGLLYPAVDNEDTLYVAWVQAEDGVMSLERYTLDGKYEETLLRDVKIKIPTCSWYYMKCLSPNTIVFCTAGTMYAFRTHLRTLTAV